MDHSNARRGSSCKGVEPWRTLVSDAVDLNSASTDDRLPPEYTTMQEGSQVAGDSATCCAFLNFSLGVRDVSEYSCLLEQYQRLAFLSWVALDRRPAQNIPNLERLSCPLLWCRKSFDDHDKLVNHVSTCSFLEQGEYWCPYHQQAERFSTKHPRKHFFKGAVNAIRKLGSKSIRKAIHPSKSRSSRDARWSKHHHASSYGYDEEAVEMDEGDILELDDGTREAMTTGAFEETRQEAFAGFLPAEMEDLRSSVVELDSTMSCPPMDWESTGVPTPDSALSPISPVSATDQWKTASLGDVQSPVSPNDDVASMPWAINPMLLMKGGQPAHEKQKSHFSSESSKLGCAGLLPEIHIDTSFANLTAYMWHQPTEELPASRRETSAAHNNTEQFPTTSGIIENDIGPPTSSNNFQDSDAVDTDFQNAYVPTYLPEELNQPAMHSSEQHRRKQVMREVITEPLITTLGLEGFIPVVRDIGMRLFGPSKVSVRGLQLKLLEDGMTRAESRHLCDMFIDTVMDLCNQASGILGEDCSVEEEHCRQQINMLLQHYQDEQPAGYEINAPEVDLTPYASNDTSHSFGTPVSAGPSDPFDSYQWGFPDPSTFGGGSTSGSVSPEDTQMTFPDMPELDTNAQDENLPTTLRGPEVQVPRIKGLAPSIPSAPEAELHCDECSTVLKGKAIWLASNMQRHKREKHSDAAVRLACTVEGCDKTFIRKHNLKVHVNTVHKKEGGR